MGKEKHQEKSGSKKRASSCSKSGKSNTSSSSSSDDNDSTENEYLLQVLDLKATCADWKNLFSRSIQEDRRMLQCMYCTIVYLN
jgi:hypothetical protein